MGGAGGALAGALGLAVLLAGADGARAQERPGDGADSIRRVTVAEAVDVALRRSPVLTQAQADVSTARSSRTGAYGAFLPDVSLGYGFSDASTGRLDPTGQAITTTSYSTQLTGSVQLFDGFRRFNELESARKTVDAREATYEQRRYETALSVKQAFYNAVAARERIEVERDRVERQRNQLGFVRQQIRLGRATRSDSLRSRVDLNDARLALLNARNDARSAQFALTQAMGVDRRVAPVQEATLEPDTLAWDRAQLLRVAERRAPRVRSAREAAEAAEASADGEVSRYLPSLSFSGGWDWQGSGFPPGNRSWSLRLNGSLPIFDGLQRETSLARARAQARSARAQQRSAWLAVRSDVDDAYSQIQTALAGLDLARESVELSREDLRVTRQRYELGAATILDLQSAQIALRQAQVDVIRRKFDFQVGVARLESLLGADLDVLVGDRARAGPDGPGRPIAGASAGPDPAAAGPGSGDTRR